MTIQYEFIWSRHQVQFLTMKYEVLLFMMPCVFLSVVLRMQSVKCPDCWAHLSGRLCVCQARSLPRKMRYQHCVYFGNIHWQKRLKIVIVSGTSHGAFSSVSPEAWDGVSLRSSELGSLFPAWGISTHETSTAVLFWFI